jgi:hypothetical protein
MLTKRVAFCYTTTKRFTCSTNCNESKLSLTDVLESWGPEWSEESEDSNGSEIMRLIKDLDKLEVGQALSFKLDYWIIYIRVADDTRVFAFSHGDKTPFNSVSDCIHHSFMVMSNFMHKHNLMDKMQSRSLHDAKWMTDFIETLDVNEEMRICDDVKVIRTA